MLTVLTVTVTPEIERAIRIHCEQQAITVSHLLRLAVCQHLGQPELLQTVNPKGQPRKEGASARAISRRKGAR